MQRPQLPGSLSTLEEIQIPAVENQMIESEATMGTVSLQNKMLAIAFTNTVIFILLTVVLQLVIPTTDIALPQWFSIVIIALVMGVSVGIATFAFGRLTIKQINRNLEHFKAEIEIVVQGDCTEQPFDSSAELSKLESSLRQITKAIKSKLNQAEQKAEEQEKQNQYLEEKLMDIIRNLDLTDERKLWEAVTETPENEAVPETPTGSLLEFLDNFHKWSQLPTAPELLLGSSSLEEIQQRKDQLQYRQVWLQAILEETQREIKLISPIAQLPNPNQVKKTNED